MGSWHLPLISMINSSALPCWLISVKYYDSPVVAGLVEGNERVAKMTTIDPLTSLPDASVPIVLFSLVY